MPVYINAASTISHQPTFGVPGFSSRLAPLTGENELVQPSYKAFIDPVLLRRMSAILRMGVACSKDALTQAGGLEPGAIIVGTGLGCLQDTEKFLNNFLSLEGLIPPTAFILSTHNTIAGQISLSLGCHAYNITHTQNSVSFEMALIDALMKIAEDGQEVLVGAADEHIPFLDQVASEWGYSGVPLASGVSFCVLSPTANANSLAEVPAVSVEVGAKKDDYPKFLEQFLERNQVQWKDIAIVLGSHDRISEWAGEKADFVNYLSLSGLYPTASAFAFHYGADFLHSAREKGSVLIVNTVNPGNLGLVLLKPIEA